MKSVRICAVIGTLGLAGSMPACAVDTSPDSPSAQTSVLEKPESIGKTSQAIASLGYVSWSSGNSSPGFLGPADDRTCWLTGLHGALNGDADNGSPEVEANVKVFIENGSWWVSANKGKGGGIIAHATCMPTGPDVIATREFHGLSVKVGQVIGSTPRNSKKHCFMTEVGGTDGWNAWDGSYALIKPSTHFAGGLHFPIYEFWLYAGPQSEPTTSMRMRAVCFDVDTTLVSSFTEDEPGINQLGMWNSTCGLTGLVGTYRWGSTALGAEIRPNGAMWELAIDGSNRQINGKCLM